ncbi:hypothetical protein N9E22_00095 [Burkholderiales bacterium]|nr:hypothetical protein [Burkholderiales bacterium]
MRYVLIVMLLFSAPAQAEEWKPLVDDAYVSDLQIGKQHFLAKILVDKIADYKSAVIHFQIECANGKPVRERSFYELMYSGRMGTGDRTVVSAGNPWIPFESFRFEQVFGIWCEVIDEAQP